MRYAIWGAGLRGERIVKILGAEKIAAFIDSDSGKVGSDCCGKKIISLQEYNGKYSDCFIIVSPAECDEILRTLGENGIRQYFALKYEISEFKGYGFADVMDRLDLSEYRGKDIYIYGLSVFGLELYEKLAAVGAASVRLIAQGEPLFGQLGFLRENYPGYRIYEGEVEDIPDSADILCATSDYYIVAEDDIFSRKNLVNMFDLSDRIKEYYNPKLEMFRDMYKGKHCFIVANGPSLRVQDLETLHRNNELCFGVNKIYKLQGIAWRPDFYVVTDEAYLKLFKDDVCAYGVKYKFIGTSSEDFWTDGLEDEMFKFHGTNFLSKDDRLLGNLFSENIPQKVYGYTSVVYACIQLAAYMGFTKIYLLGADCDFKGKKYSHFYEDEKECSNLMHGDQELSFQEYAIAKTYADAHGISIYNATWGGRLEVFERVDFDSLFSE